MAVEESVSGLLISCYWTVQFTLIMTIYNFLLFLFVFKWLICLHGTCFKSWEVINRTDHKEFLFNHTFIFYVLSCFYTFATSIYIYRYSYLSYSQTGRPRVYFRGRYRRLKRGGRKWYVKIGTKRYKLRRTGRRVKIYFQKRWRRCKKQRGKWYILMGRRWKPIVRRRGRWYLNYRRRLMRLQRKAKMLMILFKRTWARMMMMRRRLYMMLGRKWKPVVRRRTYHIRYHGRRLRVKRRGRAASVRYHGRWCRRRRIVTRRPRRTCKCDWYFNQEFVTTIG